MTTGTASVGRNSPRFYFKAFEDRMPPPLRPTNRSAEALWQILASATALVGLWYLWWRWSESLNMEALWLSVPLLLAESLSYVGMLLFFHNLWHDPAIDVPPPPQSAKDCGLDAGDLPLSVDVFITTYDEDPELVRLSIADALRMTVPDGVEMNVHVLDDGSRLDMWRVTQQEGAYYISRNDNTGFKAGNLRNALSQTHGDIVVILDADTRPLPALLQKTLGHFRDPDVAWVQTPQWFYDIPKGTRAPEALRRSGGVWGRAMAKLSGWATGHIRVGRDPFGLDPEMFYDVIQRRRNAAGASFCCGAGSLHRRDAIMEGALRRFARETVPAKDVAKHVSNRHLREVLSGYQSQAARLSTDLTPYRFHVSEDIYTSLILHADQTRKWKSILHPEPLSRALSPQDVRSFLVQRFKYAGGTVDIARRDIGLLFSGMPLRAALMYAMTFFSHFSPLWEVVFLAVPLITLVSGISPVAAYGPEFFLHFLPFIILHECALMLATWGVDNARGTRINMALLPLKLQALWAVARGRKIRFAPTPKNPDSRRDLAPVRVHLMFCALTLIALGIGGWQANQTRDPVTLAALAMNAFWALRNMWMMASLVSAALFQPRHDTAEML